MKSMDLDRIMMKRILTTLITEAYVGPDNPGSTWFTDNEKGSGYLGSIEALSAEEASRPFGPSDKGSAASHAGHIFYALSLANRALRGEDAYANSDWSGSWKNNKVDAAEWKELLAGIRREYLGLIEAVDTELCLKDEMTLTGTIANIAHGAWHLGAIHQGLGLIHSPGNN